MDWIKMRTSLQRDADVVVIQRLIKASDANAIPRGMSLLHAQYLVIGALHAFWSLAQDSSCDGNLGLTPEDVDELVGLKSFSSALESRGWIETVDGTVRVCKWEVHNGTGAKARALSARRQSRSRHARSVTDVTVERDERHGGAVTRGEERREEKKRDSEPPTPRGGGDQESPPLPGAIDTPEVALAWNEYERSRRESRASLTPTSRRRAVQKLARLAGVDPDVAVRILAQSVENGWKGLFPLQADRGANGRPKTYAEEAMERHARNGILSTEMIDQ